jgi:hypothetical protein
MAAAANKRFTAAVSAAARGALRPAPAFGVQSGDGIDHPGG